MRCVLAPVILVERTRGWRRRLLILLYTVVLAVAAMCVWRVSNYLRVPDIGDPFDVEAFKALALPPERDATPQYQKAIAQLVDPNGPDSSLYQMKDDARDWAKTSPKIRAWAEQNRRALELWREATDRPDAMLLTPREIAARELGLYSGLSAFWVLADLEATRLEAAGEMAGAWRWHRAILRSHRHTIMNSQVMMRNWFEYSEGRFLSGVLRWSKDPTVGAPLLETAVADVLAVDAMTPSDEFTLKAEYLNAMRELNDPQASFNWEVDHGNPWEAHVWIFGREHAFPVAAHRFLRGEPELSKRVARLVYANWLAGLNQTPARPVIRVVVKAEDVRRQQGWTLDLFEPDSGNSASARLRPARDVARVFARSIDAKHALWRLSELAAARARERTRRGDLAYILAEEWYRREHQGTPPPTPQALLGRYLKRLPEPDESAALRENVPEYQD
jgi:hypothetical protein